MNLPANFLARLLILPRHIALREMDRELVRLSHRAQGNAQIIPMRTKSRRTISEWPQPPMGGVA